jgi:hypothetical protein
MKVPATPELEEGIVSITVLATATKEIEQGNLKGKGDKLQ